MGKKLISMLMLVVLLVSAAALAGANPKTVGISYPVDRTNLTYGPGGTAYYNKKTSSQQNWDIRYDNGPAEHGTVSAYLYDQNSGLQSTHKEAVAMGVQSEFSYLSGRCVVGHNYKVVMTAPSLPPQPNTYTFTFEP